MCKNNTPEADYFSSDILLCHPWFLIDINMLISLSKRVQNFFVLFLTVFHLIIRFTPKAHK